MIRAWEGDKNVDRIGKNRKSENWAGLKGIEQDHQKAYKLDIFIKNSFDQEKCCIKIWW